MEILPNFFLIAKILEIPPSPKGRGRREGRGGWSGGIVKVDTYSTKEKGCNLCGVTSDTCLVFSYWDIWAFLGHGKSDLIGLWEY